ncbi:hypothetical protein K502DRAFT_368431 [Neoconidiobolus thromboides FSU 785]|nr:hypothetical protein K502DRAFT_368431 [Neoconidiobolus thromboides FSU 785]
MSLKGYIEKLESLPIDLQRNLQLMRELDASSQSLIKEVETDTNYLLENVDLMEDKQRYEVLRKMTISFGHALKQGEEKVSLAAQTYNLTDQTIRKLEEELERFEQSELIHIKPIKEMSDKRSNLKKNEGSQPNKKKKEKHELIKNRGKDKDDSNHMNADPNEPTYCYCNQVSYGDMVGCDDETCVREWFHYQCVGLKTLPKGKWYCNDCVAKRKAATRK